MGYLQEFRNTVEHKNLPDLLQIWEEYRSCDSFDSQELLEILTAIYHSPLSEAFGPYAESAVGVWEGLVGQNEQTLDQIITLIVDLQTTNTPQLAQICLDFLRKRFENEEHFDEKLRFVGLKTLDHFQGALRNFQLLAHLVIGNFVYHTAGWGVGEIGDVSFVREQVTLEFENVYGVREITLENAFSTLQTLSKEHFLARRFGDPDKLEALAKKQPLEVIHILLRDFGPKAAAEIKEELCEWVISKEDWGNWWQATRNKLKKDGKVACPTSLKDPFRLRAEALSQEDELMRTLARCANLDQKINAVYTFMRDCTDRLRNAETKQLLGNQLADLRTNEPNEAQKFEIDLLLGDLDARPFEADFVRDVADIDGFVQQVQILALKKRFFMAVRAKRDDWSERFAELLSIVEQNGLREYVFRELIAKDTAHLLQRELAKLLEHPERAPEAFIWYFQKLLQGDYEQIPYGTQTGRCQWLQSLLILFSRLETLPAHRETVKKMQNLLTGHKFAIVREIIHDTDLAYLQEFCLLVTKCYTLGEHNVRIMKSLAAVVQPKAVQLDNGETSEASGEEKIIWATPQGLEKIQRKIEQIGNVEIIENAKEIEEARAHGDLRENSEYKFALERRARLQNDLQTLSQSINCSRLLSPYDISTDEAGVGCSVELQSNGGDVISYTILGPWEADIEKNVISHQSKLAQILTGKKVGDPFQFQGENFTVRAIRSALV